MSRELVLYMCVKLCIIVCLVPIKFSLCSTLLAILGFTPAACLFVPAVSCPSCQHSNYYNFLFCQMCGYHVVDSFIGKLRAIFKLAGCDGNWDVALGLGNPTFTSEQLQAAITPQQATPLFVHKLLLSRHIHRQMTTPGVSALALFTFARDDAFFKTLFFSGDRAHNLNAVKTQEILRFPCDDGLLFNHVWRKHSAMGPPIFSAYAAIGILLFAR